MQTAEFEYGFDDVLKDQVTGFEGRVTGRTEYLNGCRQYNLEAASSGEPKGFWFDEERLEHVRVAEPIGRQTIPGGPHATPPARSG